MTRGRIAGARVMLTVLAIGLLALAAGCSDAREERSRNAEAGRRYTQDELLRQQRYGGTYAGGHATGDTDRGAAFARWVLEQDPRREYITDAVVRGDQVLGVKVTRAVDDRRLGELLTALGRGMADAFPGRPLVVRAFDQSGNALAEGVVDPRTLRVDVQLV